MAKGLGTWSGSRCPSMVPARGLPGGAAKGWQEAHTLCIPTPGPERRLIL